MGKIISTTAAKAVARAKSMLTVVSNYILGAGGRDPSVSNPFTYVDKLGCFGSDCVGFVDWCWGLDRYQPNVFSEFDGWINTDSILLEASHKSEFFEIIDQPRPGDAVVFPAVIENGKRVECGHIGLVTAVDSGVIAWPKLESLDRNTRAQLMSRVQVIDCDAQWSRRAVKHAIDLTTADKLWNRPSARWVRYKKLAPDTIASILVNGQRIA
jgi:hypothetical protein